MKTRTETGTRMVPKTLDGKTRLVPQRYDKDVPKIPLDVEGIVLNVVIGVVVAALLVAVTWSTISIGAMLSTVAPAWAAYLVAGVFDVAWIICLMLVWLSRYEPRKAVVPRNAGWVALLVSMTLIAMHGHQQGSLAIGIAGASISAIAKGLWTLLMKHLEVPMDELTHEYLDQERQEMNAEESLLISRFQLDKRKARIRDASAVLALSRVDTDTTWSVSQTDTGQEEEVRPVLKSVSRTDSLSSGTRHTNAVSVRLPQEPSVSGRIRDMIASGMDDADIKSVLVEEGRDRDNVRRMIYRERKKTG